jgi:hypothetical protein
VFFENTEDVWEAIGEDGSTQVSRITMLLLHSQHRLCRNGTHTSAYRERETSEERGKCAAILSSVCTPNRLRVREKRE